MDLNELAKNLLSIMERQAVALEAIAASGANITNIVLPAGSEVLKAGEVLKSTIKEETKSDAKTETAVDRAAAAKKQEAAKAEEAKKIAAANAEQAKASETTSTTDASSSEEPDVSTQSTTDTATESKPSKPLNADDVRKALKEFAAVEGNAAAMELLSSFGASSVSELVGLGQETIVDFVGKCRKVAQ